MKPFLVTILVFLGLSSVGHTQIIKIRKKALYADGEKVMTISRHGLGSAMHFKCLAHDKAIICVAHKTNGTSNRNDDYRKVEFLRKDMFFYTTLSIDFKDWAGLMKREGALDEDWEVDVEGAKAFIGKYGEEQPIPAYGKRRKEMLEERKKATEN